jgi:hypothetical protein
MFVGGRSKRKGYNHPKLLKKILLGKKYVLIEIKFAILFIQKNYIISSMSQIICSSFHVGML